MCGLSNNTTLSLIGWILLLLPTNHCQQILVLHINPTQSINNTICTIDKNESFISLSIPSNNNSIQHNVRINNTSISVDFNNLPYECIKQIQKGNNNTNHLQTPINDINNKNNINKIFVNDKNTVDSQCPSQAWEFFIWSLEQWWLIYLFVILLGMIIGSIMIIIIVFCCWKYKKKKFVEQIINEYKTNKKQFKKANNISDSSIKNGIGMKNDKHQKLPKYSLIDMEDVNSNNRRHHKSNHPRRVKRKDKKRRKTLPASNDKLSVNIPDENGDLSQEEDHLLQRPWPSRMKSGSDPLNPRRSSSRLSKSRNSQDKSNIKQKQKNNEIKYYNKSASNLKEIKSNKKNKSRSRSPWREKDKYKKSSNKYEQYKFKGNSNKNELLQPDNEHNIDNKRRHSSKPKKRNKNKNKNKKGKRSKSPRPLSHDAVKENNSNINVIVNHIHHHSDGYSQYSLPKLPPIPQSIGPTKKSIGINLAKMKENNYEENRRDVQRPSQSNSLEMHSMPNNIPISSNIANEGTETNLIKNNIKIENCLDENCLNDNEIITIVNKGKHRRNVTSSLTNVNDEGIGAFEHYTEHIISDIKIDEVNDNEEESSSFTMKSGDVLHVSSKNEKNEKNENNNVEIVDENGNLMISTKKETKRYKLPKAITKGQWM